ncbi:MAG: hypothetical protein A2Y15_03525 [Clostridiales bacterium GWF2_36_10]|nr:MAG: hypothetical protein A2Y15_03525 [Clostridiales bacterium GWF2_36_10]HAN20306.1 DUF454 domain-containing protein [Clostridiales bacterium]
MKTLKKYFLITAGTLSLILGIIGVFIPVLPTTPFLLLSSFCYMKGSERLYRWLINSKQFGTFITNYTKYKVIKKNTKIVSLIFLWLSLCISFFLIEALYIRILIITIGIGVSIHLLILKTIK